MELFGREIFLAEVRCASSGVVLIQGDSGIGKSQILKALDDGWASSDFVPGARKLSAEAGSLRSTIAEELAEVLWQIEDDNPITVRQVWDGLIHLVDRASLATSDQFGKLLLARISSLVRQKFGEESSAITDTAISELIKPMDGNVEQQLQAIPTSDAATQLLSIISELGRLIDRRLILRLDSAELLSVGDLELLGELCERSMPALLIVATFNTAIPEVIARLDILETRSGHRLTLTPLARDAIAEWLVREDISLSNLDAICRVSSGYPFFVQEAISLIAGGEEIHSIDHLNLNEPNGFTSLMTSRWNSLGIDLRRHAITLSAFASPPHSDFCSSLLKISLVEWGVFRASLIAAGVFVAGASGEPWFHDRRRNYIWNKRIAADAKGEIADQVIAHLRTTVDKAGFFEYWVTEALGELLEYAAEETREEGTLGKILGLSRGELALVFALIELSEAETEDQPHRFVSTREAFPYAWRKLSLSESASTPLDQLVEKGIVWAFTQESVTLMTLATSDPLALSALMAMCNSEFGSMPIPHMKTALFRSVVRPLLGPFLSASIHASGTPSLRESKRAFAELNEANRDVLPSLLSQASGLSFTTRVEENEIDSTVLFSSPEDRETSLKKLEAHQASPAQRWVEVSNILALPISMLPSHRLTQICKYLNLNEAPALMRTGEEVELWLGTSNLYLDAFRQLLPSRESSAYRLGSPRSIIINARESGDQLNWAELWVSGSTSAQTRRIDAETANASVKETDPEDRLRQAGALHPHELITVSARGSMPKSQPFPHAALRAAKQIEEDGKEFNRQLPVMVVAADENEIAKLLRAEIALRRAITTKIDEIEHIPGSETAYTNSVFIAMSFSSAQNSFGWYATAYEVADGQSQITVRIVPNAARLERYPSPSVETAVSLGMDESVEVASYEDGAAAAVIGGRLGYDISSFRIAWSDSALTELTQ